ncbi:hypothetical protein JZ751_008048 [Albula glossodonta]|uniref:IF rod domain-containing protein n=1 Tax=Albula glossodonta TaxID=121402 RepID=A0A8T2NYR8_9TELE|nr:hypothetical protein JZ751_008048 [Albula glossodonta]
MSIVVTRSSAASTASGNLLNSSVSYSGGKYMSGGYSSRSVLTSSRRSPSVYGGAGGYGTRISTALPTFGSASSATEFSFNTNEKLTMQNLNDRLASYLEKVGSLESANRKLELQIRELYDKRTPTSKKDLSGYYATISELRKKISHGFRGHASVTLQVDNARLAADDFRMKYDAEMNLRLATEADMGRLKRVLEELTMSQSDLEIQVDGLNEDLTFVQKNHSEELESLRAQQCGSVNVEMDCARSMDLSKEMHAMREQYETMVDRNRQEAEAWFQGKVCGSRVSEQGRLHLTTYSC